MATFIDNGQQVTLGATTEIEYQFNSMSGDIEYTALIDVPSTNSGTIQFSVGKAVGANQWAVPAGTRIFLTFRNGQQNIHAKGSNAADKFTALI